MFKSYELRCLDLEDEIWLKHEFGTALAEQFAKDEIDLEIISRIAYRLIVDKSDFIAVETEIIDEDGEKKNIRLGGHSLFIKSIKGIEDKQELLIATIKAMNSSRPKIDDSDVKKKI